jgi:hypothetical protein
MSGDGVRLNQLVQTLEIGQNQTVKMRCVSTKGAWKKYVWLNNNRLPAETAAR